MSRGRVWQHCGVYILYDHAIKTFVVRGQAPSLPASSIGGGIDECNGGKRQQTFAYYFQDPYALSLFLIQLFNPDDDNLDTTETTRDDAVSAPNDNNNEMEVVFYNYTVLPADSSRITFATLDSNAVPGHRGLLMASRFGSKKYEAFDFLQTNVLKMLREAKSDFDFLTKEM